MYEEDGKMDSESSMKEVDISSMIGEEDEEAKL